MRLQRGSAKTIPVAAKFVEPAKRMGGGKLSLIERLVSADGPAQVEI
jgi:hypothetical protein